MSHSIRARVTALGHELPEPALPGATYVPFHIHNGLLTITGQLCQWNGERHFVGKIGETLTLEDARAAARMSALNVISQIVVATDDRMDRVASIFRLGVYFNATPDFSGHSQAANGASDLFVEVFGDAGRHTRVAYGVSGLPYGVAAEVEAMVSLRD